MNRADFVNIAAHLPEMAGRQPDTPAIIFPRKGRILSFRELNRLSDRIAHGLVSCGIGRGVRTCLMVTPGPDFFALTFALFKVGAVPVLVDPGLGIRNLKKCLAEAEPHAFIGIPKAHVARLLFGWGKQTLRTFITVGPRLFWQGTTLAALINRAMTSPSPWRRPGGTMWRPSSSPAAAPVRPRGRSTATATSRPRWRRFADVYGIEPGEIDLPTFPLFALFAPALGMTAVIPEMDFTRPGSVNPRKIITAIETYKVTTMFGSPALINRVGRYGAKRGTQAPLAQAGHLRRRAGAGRGPGALRRHAQPGGRDLHPLRGHRSAAGLLHRQPRNSRRDAAA